MKKTKMEKGITLVALIITIIVLLMLAVVSIRAVQGDGIIQHAKNAKSEYQIAQESEQTMLQDYLDVLNVNDANASVLDGKGTETEPYLISSIEDLILFGYDVNGGNNYQGKYVKLEKDLDFNSDESYENPNRTNYSVYGYEGNLKTALTSGEGFIPIGISSDTIIENSFVGIFDGNGKIISNLRINKEGKIVTDIGLFTANLGEIKNLGMKNCDINISPSEVPKDGVNCGSICGYNYGKITNCWASGGIEIINNITTVMRIAGISGAANVTYSNNVTIENCYNEVNINFTQESTVGMKQVQIGGILGGSTNTEIIGCYNVGNIIANCPKITVRGCVGGITGFSIDKVRDCYNVGNIIASCDTGVPFSVGGITGAAVNESISGCYNLGSISSICSTGSPAAGGIVGAIGREISNCYNLGQVKGITTSGTPYVGGICGGDCYEVDNCCNTGVILYEGDSTKYVGAMIGQMRGNLTNSYFLNNTELTGIARKYTSTPEPTKVETIAEMPTVLEIVGSGFKADTNNINNGYPILSWQ